MIKNAIEIKNLKKIYDNQFEALKSIDLNIPKGSFYGLLGPNGAGKTTTIGAISGLVNYANGSISVMGYDNKKEYRITRGLIGLSPQELNFDVFFPIKKVLEFQAGYYGLSYNVARERTELMLEQFGLTEKRNSTCRELSGGMKRRLQIAKALIHNPEILILDEPTAGVDIELRYMLWDFLKKINQEGKTILLTTHYIEEAELLCDNVAIIDEGKILKMGSPKKLTKELGDSGITVKIGQNINNADIDSVLNGLNYTVEDSRLHFSVKDPEKSISEIIQRLTKINVPLQSITTETSSLEDVFLDLTGQNLNDG